MIKPLLAEKGEVRIIDQTLLPEECRWLRIHNHQEMIVAIKRLAIRGAPAIGIAAAYGLYLGMSKIKVSNREAFLTQLKQISEELKAARPTAVNLSWAVERVIKKVQESSLTHPEELLALIWEEAGQIHKEDIKMCHSIARNGLSLIPEKATILTHCNTGGLATGGLGTALGIIITAAKSSRSIQVYVDETRPLLQGARLTMWELQQENIPSTLITDSTAALLISSGKIDCIIVGADRIASNGDTANKIGTLNLAILAERFNVPFYVAAPSSTIDRSISSGQQIPIEERDPEEITYFRGHPIAPSGSRAYAPAFDVTPARLIKAIITENQVYSYPFHFL